jgi:hypothetical protein
MAAWTGRRGALRRRQQSSVQRMTTSKPRTRFPTGLANVASQSVMEEPNAPCFIETFVFGRWLLEKIPAHKSGSARRWRPRVTSKTRKQGMRPSSGSPSKCRPRGLRHRMNEPEHRLQGSSGFSLYPPYRARVAVISKKRVTIPARSVACGLPLDAEMCPDASRTMLAHLNLFMLTSNLSLAASRIRLK